MLVPFFEVIIYFNMSVRVFDILQYGFIQS